MFLSSTIYLFNSFSFLNNNILEQNHLYKWLITSPILNPLYTSSTFNLCLQLFFVPFYYFSSLLGIFFFFGSYSASTKTQQCRRRRRKSRSVKKMPLHSSKGIFNFYFWFFNYFFALWLQRFGILFLCRYDATMVFTLLQEVAHYPRAKIDWSELVKKSATGISNVREYQMLWRHLAYRHSLPQNFEDGAQPLVCVTYKLLTFQISNFFAMLMHFYF